MAKYYVDFLGLNTFIYDNVFYKPTRNSVAKNIIGATAGLAIGPYKNSDFPYNLPNTASFFPVIMLGRNGPYGYSSFNQIRVHQNPVTRRQNKENILTIVADTKNISSYDQINDNGIIKYVDRSVGTSDWEHIEVFTEPPVSFGERPLEIVTKAKGLFYIEQLEMSSKFKYFENDRLNNLYTGYDFTDELNTDPLIKERMVGYISNYINQGRDLIGIAYSNTIYPPRKSLKHDVRTRQHFYFPWKDSFNDRFGYENRPYVFGDLDLEVAGYTGVDRGSTGSMWPLDINKDYLTVTASNPPPDGKRFNVNNAGILQNNFRYVENFSPPNASNLDAEKFLTQPLYSYKHTITPLTSNVAPHGMRIEGVNSGSLYANLDPTHTLSGEAFWDAPNQYGTGPFYNEYEDYVYDIKRIGKDYSIIPEFRSSLLFDSLQNKPDETPPNFLEITGGHGNLSFSSSDRIASSSNPDFFQVYSHSDLLKNFDVVQEMASAGGKAVSKISLTCKAIKKFVPYEGFYPAQRTVEIANKFMESVYPQCAFSSSNLGIISASSELGIPYFSNIVTPMFAPGILYNSIKSGIAVDYPVITSSVLSVENGGVRVLNDDFYIQKPFEYRVPFEALLEPAAHMSNIDFHSNEPHPSGNLSGSARWAGTGDTKEYQLMMHNFLSETANFFLQDQNFSFLSSKKSDELNLKLTSGSIYALDITLYKSQNIASDRFSSGGDLYSSMFMTGSDVNENFTMYSRPSAFGPSSIITGSRGGTTFTGSYSHLGYNWSFTPPYYDGISKVSLLYRASKAAGSSYTVAEIFNDGLFIENRYSELENETQIDSTSDSNGFATLGNNLNLGRLGIPSVTEAFLKSQNAYDLFPHSMMLPLSSLNINLGILKEVDLLDDDSSDVVKVAVDISSEQKSQLIIQPKWETPILNFNSYGSSSTVSLPLIASQSAPRGMWHQYGSLEEDPSKGIFMQITKPKSNFILSSLEKDGVGKFEDLAPILGFDTAPVKLGKTAAKKVIREAIVAVPFVEYRPTADKVERQRVFFPLPEEAVARALDGDPSGDPSIRDMYKKMERYVMPPMFNFAEDKSIVPFTMYIFEFTHVLDQEDLAAIWQNLPPKIMTGYQTIDPETRAEEVTIKHGIDVNTLLSTFATDEQGGVDAALKKMKWLVFKVKQKAQQNYYDKIVGETKKLNKTSPYSHNWPYDYFSLVELAKIEAKCGFTLDKPVAKPSRSTKNRRQVLQNEEPPVDLTGQQNQTAAQATTSRLPVEEEMTGPEAPRTLSSLAQPKDKGTKK